MNYQKMPFGKYKGWSIEDIPTTYLVYGLEEFELPEELRNEFLFNLFVRLELPFERLDISDFKIKGIYRELSKKYHPDKGGSDQAMAAINDFRDRLL